MRISATCGGLLPLSLTRVPLADHMRCVTSAFELGCNASVIAGDSRKAADRICGIRDVHVEIEHVDVDREAPRLVRRTRRRTVFVHIVLRKLNTTCHKSVNIRCNGFIKSWRTVESNVSPAPVIDLMREERGAGGNTDMRRGGE